MFLEDYDSEYMCLSVSCQTSWPKFLNKKNEENSQFKWDKNYKGGQKKWSVIKCKFPSFDGIKLSTWMST